MPQLPSESQLQGDTDAAIVALVLGGAVTAGDILAGITVPLEALYPSPFVVDADLNLLLLTVTVTLGEDSVEYTVDLALFL